MCFSLQDPSGTLTRTLPPLNSSFSASASGRGLGSLGGLPPLSGTNGMGDNPLNKPLLAPVKRGEGNFLSENTSSSTHIACIDETCMHTRRAIY